MYSEDDISSAVTAGALSEEAAASLRAHVASTRAVPQGAEENFRLINSFNDIFVTIGIVILLVAVGAIGQAIAGILVTLPADPMDSWDWRNNPGFDYDSAEYVAYSTAKSLQESLSVCLAGIFVALTAWPLAEFFTRKRRMALPSIILLLAFVGGVFFALSGLGTVFGFQGNEPLGAALIAVAGLIAGAAAYGHWRRFQVPITVAAGVGVCVVALLVALLGIAQLDPDQLAFLAPILAAGLGIFTLAMRWDISDRARTTRRSDVAFWLHLLAAPMIAHPIFALLGVTEGNDVGIGAALSVLLIYIGFGVIALAIDRRALLVSALAYVLFALTFLFREFGAVELNFALTALVIGSALLSLSAFWQVIRGRLVEALPQQLQARLPEIGEMPSQLAPA